MNLLERLQKNPYMRAVPLDRVPPTKGINHKGYSSNPAAKWLKPVSVVAPKIQATPSPTPPRPRRNGPSLDRNQRAKAARLLESHNRQTRMKGPAGRTDQGALKASGVEIGKELLFHWYNPKTGELYVADDTVAQATGWSRRTVQRARERLRAAGLLSWFRRSRWTADGWKPTSNRYFVGQLGPQIPVRNIKEWGGRAAASPSAPLLALAVQFGVVLNVVGA